MSALPLSPHRAAAGLVITSGQVGFDASGELVSGLEQQVEVSIANLRRVLEEAGSSLDQVVSTRCYLSTMDDFAAFNEIYVQHFSEPFPARTTVGVELLGDILFEIEAVAGTTDR